MNVRYRRGAVVMYFIQELRNRFDQNVCAFPALHLYYFAKLLRRSGKNSKQYTIYSIHTYIRSPLLTYYYSKSHTDDI